MGNALQCQEMLHNEHQHEVNGFQPARQPYAIASPIESVSRRDTFRRPEVDLPHQQDHQRRWPRWPQIAHLSLRMSLFKLYVL